MIRAGRVVLIAGYLGVASGSILTIVRLKRHEAELRRNIDAAGGIVIICDRGWRHHPPTRQ